MYCWILRNGKWKFNLHNHVYYYDYSSNYYYCRGRNSFLSLLYNIPVFHIDEKYSSPLPGLTEAELGEEKVSQMAKCH